MSTRSTSARLAVGAASLLLVTGACSGDDDDGAQPDTTTTVAEAEGVTLTADLTPEAAVPDGGLDGASGSAELRVDEDAGTICSVFEVEGVAEVINVHLHMAAEGEQGPIIFPLYVDGDDLDNVCVEPPATVITDLLESPEDFYLNVRSPDAPTGAIRGQLSTSG